MKTDDPFDEEMFKFYNKIVRITIVSEESSTLYSDDIHTSHEGILARRTITDYDKSPDTQDNKVVEFWFANCNEKVALSGGNGTVKQFICEVLGE